MKYQWLLCLTIFYGSLGHAQNVPMAREALFSGDVRRAETLLAGPGSTAEVQLLRSLTDLGLWFEEEVAALVDSVGKGGGSADAHFELSGLLGSAPLPRRDLANAAFAFDLVELTDRPWQIDGRMDLPENGGSQTLDVWLSSEDLFSHSWPILPMYATFEFQAAARAVDLRFFTQPSGSLYFNGDLLLNGIPIGEFGPHGFESELWGLDRFEFGGGYTVSLDLEPGDRLTLEVDPDWYFGYSGSPDPYAAAFGLKLDDPADFVLRNGVGIEAAHPVFQEGVSTENFAAFLLRTAAPTEAVLSRMIARLEGIQPGFSVSFSPSETGLLETVRVEHADVQILLAGLKFLRGLQAVLNHYGSGSIDLSGTAYLDYLAEPVALWEDHPGLLGLRAGRQAGGAEIRRFFEEAVAHYDAVESELWTRLSGLNERFLFEVDLTDLERRTAFAKQVTNFKTALTDFVSLDQVRTGWDATQSLSLAPFFAETPLNLRPLVPPFDERGLLLGNAGPFVGAGLTRGISAFQVDKALAENELLYIPPKADLTGKILHLNAMVEPYWGATIDGYLFNANGSVSAAGDGMATVRAYTWDPDTGIFHDLTANQAFRLVFETAASGWFERLSTTSDPYFWPEEGRFILYDGDRDLDQDGQSDSAQLSAGFLPLYPSMPGDSVFEDFADDWDGDGVPDGHSPEPTVWYSAASHLANGWRYFPWFKGFKPLPESNWIYHGRHGWLLVKGNTADAGLFLWDGALGRWMWTSATVYPWMYAYGPNEGWVWFFEGGRPGSRYFKRGGSGEVISENELGL